MPGTPGWTVTTIKLVACPQRDSSANRSSLNRSLTHVATCSWRHLLYLEELFSLPFFWGRGVQALRLGHDFCTVFSCLGLLFHLPWCCQGLSETLGHLVKAKVYIFLAISSSYRKSLSYPLAVLWRLQRNGCEIHNEVVSSGKQVALMCFQHPSVKLDNFSDARHGDAFKVKRLPLLSAPSKKSKTKAHFLVTEVILPSFV